MPTADRADFALQAIAYFEQQDYPQRELVIVDDGERPLADLLPVSQRIRYLRLEPRVSIGAKRNLACEFSTGEIIAQWDDDDYYTPGRLSLQVAPLLAGKADITGLEAIFFDLERWGFWRLSRELHRRMFVGDVHGGTLVFHRRVWEDLARYPRTSLAEDADLLGAATDRGARLVRLAQDGREPVFLYVRHGANTWRVLCGHHLDPRGWHRDAEPTFTAADRSFYAARSAAAPVAAAKAEKPRRWGPARQLVSCLMPTADRHAFVLQSIHYFQRQDYPERELLIVDDGAEPVGKLLPADPRIRYIRLAPQLSLGEKRNVACDAAAGEILVHWDDDDWQAPWRLRYQVALLASEEAELCGLDRLFFYDPRTAQLWLYTYPSRAFRWLAGGTLCYARSLWRRHPFASIDVGEDNHFVFRAARLRQAVALEDAGFYVALIHPENTSAKTPGGRLWRPLDSARAAQLLGDDLAFYHTLREVS